METIEVWRGEPYPLGATDPIRRENVKHIQSSRNSLDCANRVDNARFQA